MKHMKAKEESGLYVVEVLPLVRGWREPSATYFSAQSYPPGSVVQVPVRSKEHSAVVISSEPVSDAKAHIKSVGFVLRKISQQKERYFFRAPFLPAVKELSNYYATSPGEIMSALTPASVLESDIDILTSSAKEFPVEESGATSFVQGDFNTRVSEYKKLIKKRFTKGQSVLILSPTLQNAELLTEFLGSQNLSGKLVELSSRFNEKKQIEKWREIINSNEPVVVVVTPAFLSVPIANLSLCIVDEIASSQYIGLKKPYLDGRVALKKLAKFYGVKLILGDILIPVSELKDATSAQIEKLKTVQIQASAQLITMNEETPEKKDSKDIQGVEKKKPFKMISNELLSLTKKAIKDKEKIFWFVARRGLYPSTVCEDCGAEYSCARCGSSMSLHEKNKQRFFLCHRCGHQEDALATCKACGSWRLKPLGIGVERVFEEAEQEFDNPQLISADVTTKTKIKSIVKSFYESNEGQLLIGTDLTIPYLKTGVDYIGVVTIDSRLALPLYNAEESALRTLLTLNSLANKESIVQTRRSDSRIFASKDGDNLDRFRNEELALRKAFQYPPYGMLITITARKSKEKSESKRAEILSGIERYLNEGETISLLPLRGTKKQGIYIASMVLKLKKNLEENTEMRRFLRSLTPDIEVRVGPENLW